MPKAIPKGIVISNLPSCITKEILFSEFKKKKIDGALNFKVTRVDEKQAKKLKEDEQPLVKAFVGFTDINAAISARNQLTHTREFEKFSNEECVSRVSLIIPKENEKICQQFNYVITNLPDGIDPREFDEAIQKFGTVISTDIARGKGFVQFQNQSEAKDFELACRNQTFKLKDQPIDIKVFKKSTPKKINNTLYFKNFNQAVSEDKEEEVKEQIKSHLQQVLEEVKENIASIIVSFSLDYKKPYAFVNFKAEKDTREESDKATEEVTKRAKEIYESAESENKFEFVTFPDPDYKNNASKHFVYMKPLKSTVTQEQLTNILKEILGEQGVESVRVKQPSHPAYYDTQFATVLTKEANKQDQIKEALNSKSPFFKQEFLDLFSKDNKTRNTVCACFPYNRHQQWLKRRQERAFSQQPAFTNYQQYQQQMFGQQPPFIQQQMFNPMMQSPFMNQMPLYPPQNFMQIQQGQKRYSSQKPQQYNQTYQQHRQFSQNPRAQHRQQQNRNQQYPQHRRPQQQNRPQQPRQQQQPQQQQQKGKQPQQPIQPKKVMQPKKVDPIQQIKNNLAGFKKQEKRKQIQLLGQLIYPKVQEMAKNQLLVNKIIQMLVDLDTFEVEEVIEIIEDRKQLLERIQESEELLQQQQ